MRVEINSWVCVCKPTEVMGHGRDAAKHGELVFAGLRAALY